MSLSAILTGCTQGEFPSVIESFIPGTEQATLVVPGHCNLGNLSVK